MIKRLFNITRANVNGFLRRWQESSHAGGEEWAASDQSDYAPANPVENDPLAQYYANLELQPGADRKAVRAAWKRLMKKYHPDLHETDPNKIDTANELSRKITEAYQIIDKELSKKA